MQNQEHHSGMASDEKEVFNSTGPSFLTEIDWNNSHHRRSIAASLVQGIYTLERDRRQNRQGPQALAPPWWLFFNFQLIQVLVDPVDASYFGAIYELSTTSPTHRPPRYVVAFRGSINKPGNREQDFKLNLQLFINTLEKSTRFQIAMQSLTQIVQSVGPAGIWLAGHSLGSSISLLLGKHMVKSGIHLETYLFNPPFGSPHIERIKNEKVKLGLRFANSVITAGLAAAANGVQKDKSRAVDPFLVLAGWVPYLFINPSDPVCSEYVGYFKHREDMEAMGAGKIGRLATKHSIGSVFSIGKKEYGAVHLIPSAYLSINMEHCQSFKEAHGIHQWWRPDLQFVYKYYQYKH